MDSAVIGGIVRTVLVSAGSILVTKGYVDDETLNQIVGALIVLGMGVWSVIQKKGAAKKVEVAAQTGVNPDTVKTPPQA